MLLNFITKIFGSSNERALKSMQKDVDAINALEPDFEKLSDQQLQAKTTEFRKRLDDGETLDDLMHEAFATVREAAKRTLGQRHYDVQLIGGIVMHRGQISEMRTGEGKTLVSTLPAYLNALPGKGVHIITVNDYLASRDSEWMGEIYRFLGMSVGCVTNDVSQFDRSEIYAADITYGTNNEFGFDYLRDNMRYRLDRMAQRDFNFAIIDEIDSILIDEARTPLIISGPSESSTELYIAANKLIPFLKEEDYELEEKHKNIALTEIGTEHVEALLREHGLLKDGNMYDIQNIALVHHVSQALRAHKIFSKDKDYIAKDGRIILIDEFTGRMMDGRRLSEGLHQAIEAKEGVEIQSENQTLASVTYQNYFRLYPKLAGMTGTAMTEASEFHEIYKLGVVEIPTNVPIARIDNNDKIFKSLADKDDAVIETIKACQEKQQPVLVGTVSIDKSESLARNLKKLKIPHKVLNARYHEQEAYIIAQAGRPGAVTIATNMAGRGTDIQLGGNLDMRLEAEIDPSWDDAKKTKNSDKIKSEIARDKQIVKDAGGLFVIGTERHESRRIDNQLRGRSGRQGDPGETIFFMSVEDDLMRVFAGDKLEALLASPRIGLREGEALEHPLISKMLERAQGKVESMHFEARKNILKFDDVMNDQRTIIYEQRREVMMDDSVEDLVKDMRHDVIEDYVGMSLPRASYAEQWDTSTLKIEMLRLLAMDLPIDEWAKEEGIADGEIKERLIDLSDKRMAEKAANIGPQIWRNAEKSIVLQMLDQHWKEHLLALDHLRQGINLRAFGQRDPLNEYKTEAFAMFETMLEQLRETITTTLSLVEIARDANGISMLIPGMMDDAPAQGQETRQDPAMQQKQQKENVRLIRKSFDKNDPTTWGKVQRNASCPCGSGKKFKQCHGALQQTQSI